MNRPATGESRTPPDVRDDMKLVVSRHESLQFNRQRNVYQGAAVLFFVGVGAIIGCCLTDNRRDLAALAGGVVGMVVGTFVSGFVLMLTPPPAVTMTLGEIRTKYRKLKRQFMIVGPLFLISMLMLPFVISRFGHDDSDFAWLMCAFWFAATMALCVYSKTLAYELREWKCPVCDRPFGRLWSSCSNCGLPLNPDRQLTT